MTFYDTQNPGGTDNGMDIQTALEDLTSAGGPDDVKAVGFAQVNHSDTAEVQAAIAIFGSVWTGINVLDVNEQQFSASEPWDYSPTGSIVGGHSVITGGYGVGAGVLSGNQKFITWAQETSFTDAYWSQEVEEAWVVIWPEHLGSREFLAGVDLAGFAADYTTITSSPFPAAPVVPVPEPVPAPAALADPVPRWGA